MQSEQENIAGQNGEHDKQDTEVGQPCKINISIKWIDYDET
jgi:hypothetical protein